MERRTVSGDTNVSISESKVSPFESLHHLLPSSNMMNLPDAAFGSAGNTMERRTVSGDTNVSISESKVSPFESLQRTLGKLQQAGDYLLTTFLASRNNNNCHTLVSAYEQDIDDGSYQMEYIIDRSSNDKPSLQAISINNNQFRYFFCYHLELS